MPRGPQPPSIILTDDERDKLNAWVCRPTTQQRLALRARIVLAAATGPSNTAIATDLRITLPTVRKWRSRFAVSRLDGLTDEPRPGATRTITDTQVEQALARTLETKPKDATHWSTRTLACDLGLSQTASSGPRMPIGFSARFRRSANDSRRHKITGNELPTQDTSRRFADVLRL
jgi:transposase